MRRYALAVDLGGTNLRCAAVSDDGHVLTERQQPTDAQRGPEAVIASIVRIINETAAASGIPQDAAVGIAAPGPLNPRSGVVFFAPNLPGWRDIPLRERIAEMTGRAIVLGNDANAAALGEWHFGAGKGLEHLIYIGLGTGVGGGVISHGRLIDGVHGMGGELGHVSVNIDGPLCHCGSRGCIEAYCSGWALADAIAAAQRSGHDATWSEAAETDEFSPAVLRIAAERGDAFASATLERAGTALGVGLANFINIFNPQLIVLGGGLIDLGEPLLVPVQRSMQAWAMPMMYANTRLTYSKLGRRTGIYGAAALVFLYA
ncbi:MAG: transcriptional regulator [Chloroflexi bacterium]|nr:MAG: transcriptional regulator [Chloroflexota bacterium]